MPAPSIRRHAEPHYSHRGNWLRAAVLGANDGLISTASLMTGIAAASPDASALMLTGVAALAGGALSMAAGEYVSVSSQSDTERADREMERRELAAHPQAELQELQAIYQQRGLSPELARQVAEQLSAHNALDAHLRDEIGLTETAAARPLQAALASAAAFTAGAALPLAVSWLTLRITGGQPGALLPALGASTLLGLAALGYASARLGGAPARPAVLRVLAWGCLALGMTAGVGKLMGVSV